MNWRKIANYLFIATASVIAVAGALAVIAAAGALSFDGGRAVAVAARIREPIAWLWPIAVDGTMAVATVVAIMLYRLTGRHHMYPWIVLGAGVVISMAANAVHAADMGLVLGEPWVRMIVGMVPPMLLALSVHLLAILIMEARDTVTKADMDTPASDRVDRRTVDTATTTVSTMSPARMDTAIVSPTGLSLDMANLAGDRRRLDMDTWTGPVASDTDVAEAEAAFRGQVDSGQDGVSIGDEAEHYLDRLSKVLGPVPEPEPAADVQDVKPVSPAAPSNQVRPETVPELAREMISMWHGLFDHPDRIPAVALYEAVAAVTGKTPRTARRWEMAMRTSLDVQG